MINTAAIMIIIIILLLKTVGSTIAITESTVKRKYTAGRKYNMFL